MGFRKSIGLPIELSIPLHVSYQLFYKWVYVIFKLIHDINSFSPIKFTINNGGVFILTKLVGIRWILNKSVFLPPLLLKYQLNI